MLPHKPIRRFLRDAKGRLLLMFSTNQRAVRRHRRLRMEQLETRLPLATLLVTNTADDGAGSLRQAIVDANATAELDEIQFNIPGTGVKTIAPLSPLPTITNPVVIDGYTQPGAAQNTDPNAFNATLLIELNGAGAGTSQAADGLRITGGGSTVRGLVINRFNVNGIQLRGAGNNRIEGNIVGADPTGMVALGNEDGVDVESPSNIVGGTTPRARNVLSGNMYGGVDIDFSGANNVVQGNLIGVAADGVTPLGNRVEGVDIGDVTGNLIGGLTAESANVIAHNGRHGIWVHGDSALANSFLGNRIFANGGLAVDLVGDGVTPNDAGDGDTGPNGLQNYPVLLAAASSPGKLQITGALDSAPLADYRMEFFASDGTDPTGFGEGQQLLGATVVTTNAAGHTSFDYEASPVAVGRWITATATRLADSGSSFADTSEFSQAVAVSESLSADLDVVITDTPDPAFLGATVTYTISVTNYGSLDATDVVVTAATTGETDLHSVTVPWGLVPAGQSRSFQFLVTPQTLGTINVVATVSAGENDPDLDNNTFTEATLIVPATTIELAAAQYEVREGEEFAVLSLRRTGSLTKSASVEFVTVDDTAKQRSILAGNGRRDDFTTTSGTLYFRPLQTTAVIRVPIRDDAILEPDESFQVVLSNPSAGAELGTITSSNVIIHDNDPTVQFAVGASEVDEVLRRVPLEVRLQPASNEKVTVAYRVVGGTATSGTDFTLADGILTFQPGETRQNIYLTVASDSIYEGDETVIIELSSARNAFLGGQSCHRVTIVDNDPQPPAVEPGSTSATALFIDLQTLPRQSFKDTLHSSDPDTFRVHLAAGERLLLDVDPDAGKVGNQTLFPGLASSTLAIFAADGETVLATVGRSAEPDTGVISNNPATMFQADFSGDYFVQLHTVSSTMRGYRLFFHRIGVAENVPAPELLNVPGEMFVWFDGVNTVGITGPTGYGFTLEGPWQQRSVTTQRSGLTAQTLTMAAGNQFILRSPQGLALPLLANDTITISTAAQRWGDIVGVVTTPAIDFPVAISIAPINDLLATVFGSEFLAFGLLNGEWRISLGGRVLATGKEDISAPIDPLLAGVPYLRQKGPIRIAAQLGSVVIDYRLIEKPVDWVFDPADPMLYLRGEELGDVKQPVLAISRHGLLEYKPQDAPSPQVSSGVTEFYGHVFAAGTFPLEVGPLPIEVDAEAVINLDADRDGLFLGDLRDVDEVFDVLGGDFSEVREVLNDIQYGANGKLNFVPGFFDWEMELGRASIVLNGLEETIWVRGQQGGSNPLAGTPLAVLNTANTIVLEGMINWTGDFFLSTTTSYSLAGIEFAYNITLTNEGIFAKVNGRVDWSVNIDYGVGTVRGTATAEIEGELAIAIGDNGDVKMSGSVSARGKLKYKNKTIFSGNIEASVRNKGLRFKFPNGVGTLNLDLFS